jgi:hypothetical protein
MPSRERRHPFLAFWPLVAAGFFSSCLFVPSHQVAVDAISAPIPAGGITSYQLVDKDPLMVRDPVLHKRVFTCVETALEAKGGSAALPGVRPDFVIEIDYGATRGVGSRGFPGMSILTELYLQLSARRPRVDGAKGKGEEIWNVRTAVREDQVTLAAIIPVLAAVAADYAGLDTITEKTIKVGENTPTVMLVKSVADAR